MKQQNLDNKDVFWLWWVLSPRLVSDEAVHHGDGDRLNYKIVSMTRKAHGGYEAAEEMADSDSSVESAIPAAAPELTEIRHYHVQRGHWYNSVPMVLLILLLVILIPIAAVIAFWIVISLFVNQSLFTMLAGL